MWLRITAVAVFTSVLVLLLPGLAAADTNDFAVTNFRSDYYLTHADRQGSLDIDEHIDVNFTDNNHGIYRALPERYNGEPLHVSVKSVTLNNVSEPYSTSTQNGNLVLKIGSASRTVTGDQSYEIKYHVDNVIRFVAGHDELDWNVNGNQWQQPFYAVQATLHESDHLLTSPVCFTGQYAQTGSDCTVESGDGQQTFTASRNLQIGETLTFAAQFASGTFAAPTWRDRVGDYARPVLEATVLPLVVLVIAGSYWYKNGRDIKGRGTIIPEYGPPNNLAPIEVDVIAHYKLSTKAISATIIDLAIRKYIRISETTESKLLGLGTTKVYSLELLTSDASQLNQYEQTILATIFAGTVTKVEMNRLTYEFADTAKSLQKLVPQQLTTAGYFTRNPQTAGRRFMLVASLCWVLGVFLFAVAWEITVALILSGIIISIFGALMPKRSQQGVDAKDQIDGLKLYMEVAEKDRIAMLQSPDAPYQSQSTAPSRTVELFEKLLPFAIVLGVENQWAKQFASIYTTPPDWYSGNWTTFNAAYLVSSLNSSMAVMNTTFATASSSGSGAGGGFAGGGGGGGGGGGW